MKPSVARTGTKPGLDARPAGALTARAAKSAQAWLSLQKRGRPDDEALARVRKAAAAMNGIVPG
ncbi:MAG: hypothetical protein ABI551_11115, partial [Polyangiaceae bacterium]